MTRATITKMSLISIVVATIGLACIAAPTSAAQSTGCTLEPVSLPLFDATPAAVIAATPQAGLQIVPELNEDGAVGSIELLLACAGAEQQDLRFAIFTDRYLANLFLDNDDETPADQPAFERMIEAGAVPEASTPALTGVSDLELLDDARVAVTVDVETASGPVHDRLVLAWDADQQVWLIDEVLALDPPLATPAA